MKKLFTFFLITLPAFMFAQSQYEYLQTEDVRFWDYPQPLSIDTLVFEIKPKGLYAEIGMYFDFSVRGTSFYQDDDSLEIQMVFKLPEKAEVTDMWLWVYETIVHAGMYDRWTANEIYEGIVSRRTDPAILYRYEIYDYIYDQWGYYQQVHYTDHYMFRIFPMAINQPRKAKITYLIPIEDLDGNNLNIPLPANIINLSNENILNCKIKYFPASGMGAPSIDNSNFQFNYVTHPQNSYYEANANNVFGITNLGSLTLSMQNTAPSAVFAGTYDDLQHNEKFYQLQVKPEDIFEIEQHKKAAVLLDFVADNSSLSAAEVVAGLKQQLLSDFEDNDSINILISGMITNVMSPVWLPADSATITDLFDILSASSFSGYSNLPTLFTDGIDFIQSNGGEGSILLLSSGNSCNSLNEANALTTAIFDQMGNSYIPVHTIDLDNIHSSNEYYYVGNTYYEGNQYFYSILTAQTGAYYLRLFDDSYSAMLQSVSNRLSDYLTSFDIFVNLESGFTYANYEIGQGSNLTWVDEPYSIVGKYSGTGNFRVTASGEASNGDLYYNELIVDGSGLHTFDKGTRSIWAGQQIREMYSYNQDNTVVSQIISTSMDERVLSNYTAFLALEPGEGPLNNQTPDEGGGGQLGVETADAEVVSFEVYPNPASNFTYLNYYLPEDARVAIELFDLFGKRIAVLENTMRQGGSYRVEINTAELESGTYIVRMITDDKEVKTRKLVIID